MGVIRKPFQGVGNVIRFNWHFYLLFAGFVFVLMLLNRITNGQYRALFVVTTGLGTLSVGLSLLTSLYVYDLSGVYKLRWLTELCTDDAKLVNINAGFDEFSSIIIEKSPGTLLMVFDFYDAEKHTEISIKRAGKAYPPFPGTIKVNTSALPLSNDHADIVLLLFAAHEIRDEVERITFFKEVRRILKPTGKVVVLEHVRDIPNFIAYNIGAFHFLSLPTWHSTFKNARLILKDDTKITPFLTKFTLEKNGITP